MAYRKTRRSKETLARMKAGKDAARMDRPAPDYPPERPELRRRLIVIDYDFGEKIHTLDLLRRGVPVYRAVTFVSAADLIIDLHGDLKRVEVRSAKRNVSGSLRYPMPADRSRYDVLALVEPDGSVTYKPGIFDVPV